MRLAVGLRPDSLGELKRSPGPSGREHGRRKGKGKLARDDGRRRGRMEVERK